MTDNIKIEISNVEDMFKGGRSRNAWLMTDMRKYILDLKAKYPNKVIKLDIATFFKQFRATDSNLHNYYYYMRIIMRNAFKDIFANPDKQINTNKQYLFLSFDGADK